MQTDRPRILLVHASAGAGHRRAAEALGQAFRLQGACVTLIDSVPLMHPLFRRLYFGGGLGVITQLPRLYDAAYRLSDRRGVDRLLRVGRDALQRASARRLLRVIDEIDPDAVLCTHFLPAELVASWKRHGQLSARVYTLITDFAAHRTWVHAALDGYFVAHAGVAQRLIEDGVRECAIHISGLPVAAEFQRCYSREALRARLGLDNARLVVLVVGGGLGAGPIEALAREALNTETDAQFVFITGTNERLRHRLARSVSDRGWPVLGFVSNMHEWLAAADVAIGKAGGMSAAEMMASGLTLVVPPWRYGHEARNARYLQTCGVAQVGESIAGTLGSALSIGRERMQAVTRCVAQLDAAKQIAKRVLTEL